MKGLGILLMMVLLMQPMVVLATELEPYDLGVVVVTSSGYEEVELDYPGNITIIDREDIEKTNVKYVYELLRKEPGVFVADYTGTGKMVNVDMRGFGDTSSRNILVMIDGRRINEIDISGTDWAQIPVENIERIEILRGSGAVLYGDNASSGVINIITKKGKGKPKAYIAAEFGSYGYKKYYGGIEGSCDFASYNFFYNDNRTKGYRTNGKYEGRDFQARICVTPADYLSIDISGGNHRDWYGLPGGLQLTEIEELGRKGSTTSRDRAKTKTEYIKVTPSLNFTTGNMSHNLIFDLWNRNRRVNFSAHFVSGGSLIEQIDVSKIYSLGGYAKYINSYSWDIATNKLTFGLDFFNAENRLGTDTEAWGTHTQLEIFKDTNGIFVNNKAVLFDKFIVNGGYRKDFAYYTFDQPDEERYEQRNIREEAYDVGLEYKYTEDGAIYGRYSRSYRFASTDEFYSRWTGLDTDLKHQTQKTWEVGLKDVKFKYIQPRINFFWMDTQDEIFYDPSSGLFGKNSNYDEVKRKGLELGLISEPFEFLDTYLNYSYVDAEFEEGTFGGKRVPMVPKNKVTFGLDITLKEFIIINYNAHYVGAQYPINDQYNRQSKLKSYFVNNIKLTVKYKGWQTFFGVNNMFDRKYSEMAITNVSGTLMDYYPAPERNYIFGLLRKF